MESILEDRVEEEEEEGASDADWYTRQIWILVIGVIFGVLTSLTFLRSGDSAMPWTLPFRKFKMVLVVRTDISASKGKIATQCAHAALICYRAALKRNLNSLLKSWEWSGEMKVTLKAGGEEELLSLRDSARNLGLIAEIVTDAGKTQIPTGTKTVLGIGPGDAEVIDKITGHLKLY